MLSWTMKPQKLNRDLGAKIAVRARTKPCKLSMPRNNIAAFHAGYSPRAAQTPLVPCPNVPVQHTIARSSIVQAFAFVALDPALLHMCSKSVGKIGSKRLVQKEELRSIRQLLWHVSLKGSCLCWWDMDTARFFEGNRGAVFLVLALNKAGIILQCFRKTWIAQEVETAAARPKSDCLDGHMTSLSLCSWRLEYVHQIRSTHCRKPNLL